MAKIESKYECGLMLVTNALGGKWKMRILWHVIHGDNRYSLLSQAIPDISSKMLTTQLKELTESGILLRQVLDDKPPKVVVYSLNPTYRELKGAIDTLHRFAQAYAKENQIHLKERKGEHDERCNDAIF